MSGTKARDQWLRVAVFVAIGLVLALVLQEVLLFGLKHCYEGNVGVMNRVALGGIRADVVISGSSRAAYHYDPAIIRAETGMQAINIGRDGTKLHEQLDLLEIYLRRNPHPQYLIQNLDATGLEENNDITDGKQYIAWLRDRQVYEPLARQKHSYWLYRCCPLLAICRQGGMDAAMHGLFHAFDKGDAFNGYCPQNLTYKPDLEKFMAKHSLQWKFEIDSAKLQSLTTLVEVCKSNRVKVILVFSPDYAGDRHFFDNRGDIIKAYQGVAQKLNVPFWDFSNDSMCSDQSCFYNSQHMNSKGSALFSRAVGQRLTAQTFPQQSSR